MRNKIILKSGDYIFTNSCRNQVDLETEVDIVFMTPEEALSVAAALIKATEEVEAEVDE